MPESGTDRLSTTYELLFLLTRSPRYYFDLDPIRLPLKPPQAADGSRVFGGARKGSSGGVGATARRRGGRYGGKYTADGVAVEPGAGRGNLVPLGHAHTAAHPAGRNPGDERLPRGPTEARTSRRSRSTCRCGRSPPVARPAAWYWIRSPGPRRPGWRPSS